jgi:hypothetical protein
MELVQNGIRVGVSGLAFAFAFALGALKGRPSGPRRWGRHRLDWLSWRWRDLKPSRVPAPSATTRR